MLLCFSTGQWGSVLEQSVEPACEVALETAVGLTAGLAFAYSPLDVADRGRVRSTSGDEDLVKCSVESAIAAAVEAVAP